MASHERLDSGLYRGIYYVNGVKQRTHAPHYATARDAKEAAEELAVKARRQAAAQAGTLSARITWADWWATFSADRVFDSDNGDTEAQIVRIYLLPRWGPISLNEIGAVAVRSWVTDLRRGRAPRDADERFPRRGPLSATYVRRIYSVFSMSIKGALDAEILTASPCVGVRLPATQKRAKTYVAVDEVGVIAPEMKEYYADAVEFLLETGLRPGELAGLHSHRIDWKRKVLTVAETYVYRKKQIRGWPKDGDTRTIPLSDKALAILKRRLAGRDLNQPCGVEHMHGAVCSHPLVFRGHRGAVMSRDTLNLQLRQAAERTETAAKSGYAFRRGFATRLAEGGLDAFALAEVMGHADINLSAEYVQQTASERARVLAALGQRPTLAAVDLGQPGTSPGTEPGSQTVSNTPKRRGRKQA